MNKLIELLSIGTVASIFSVFLIIKEGIGFYPILLFVTGIGILIYGIYNKKAFKDLEDPELYDERDEAIQNKVSDILLSILLNMMMVVLLLNSFITMPLNYVLVMLMLFTIFGKKIITTVMEKLYDNQQGKRI